jgi:hypothetical protein
VWWYGCRVGREGCDGFHIHYMLASSIIGMIHLMVFLRIISCINLEIDCNWWNWTWCYQHHETTVPFSWLKKSRNIVHNWSCIFAILLWFSLNCCIHKWMAKWTYF